MTMNNLDNLADAFADNYELFRQCGVSADDYLSLHATLGTSPAAMRDALDILSRPRYPLWRSTVDFVLMIAAITCELVLTLWYFPFEYKITAIALLFMTIHQIQGLEQRWKRKHEIH